MASLCEIEDLFLKRTFMSALLALTAILAACTSVPEEFRYRDPDLPPDQVAVLLTHSSEFPDWASIEVVDGKNIQRMGRWQQRVKVLPGKHQIGAAYGDNHGYFGVDYSWVTIPVDVEAGHTYQIRGLKSGNKVRIWLEDVESEAVIGVGTVFDASEK